MQARQRIGRSYVRSLLSAQITWFCCHEPPKDVRISDLVRFNVVSFRLFMLSPPEMNQRSPLQKQCRLPASLNEQRRSKISTRISLMNCGRSVRTRINGGNADYALKTIKLGRISSGELLTENRETVAQPSDGESRL